MRIIVDGGVRSGVDIFKALAWELMLLLLPVLLLLLFLAEGKRVSKYISKNWLLN